MMIEFEIVRTDRFFDVFKMLAAFLTGEAYNTIGYAISLRDDLSFIPGVTILDGSQIYFPGIVAILALPYDFTVRGAGRLYFP